MSSDTPNEFAEIICAKKLKTKKLKYRFFMVHYSILKSTYTHHQLPILIAIIDADSIITSFLMFCHKFTKKLSTSSHFQLFCKFSNC